MKRFVSVPVANLIAISLLWLLTGVWNARADVVVTTNSVVHGRVVAIDRHAIEFIPGCTGTSRSMPWTNAKEVLFDSRCEAGEVTLPSMGGGVCSTMPQKRFVIYFRSGAQPVLADQISVSSDQRLHYSDEGSLKQGHGPVTDVRGIAFRSVCPDDQYNILPPASFCVENTSFAANFSYDAPLPNQIVTRGMNSP